MSLVLDSWMYPSIFPDCPLAPYTCLVETTPLVVVLSCTFIAMIATLFLFSRPKLG